MEHQKTSDAFETQIQNNLNDTESQKQQHLKVIEDYKLKHQNDVQVLKKEKEKVLAKKEGEYQCKFLEAENLNLNIYVKKTAYHQN